MVEIVEAILVVVKYIAAEFKDSIHFTNYLIK
jgi:hypothetical protein